MASFLLFLLLMRFPFNRRNEMIVRLILGVTLICVAVLIYHINVKVVVSTLLLIGIIVAILKLFVWFINYNISADYYFDIKH
jgi:hypothetical protein